MSADTLRLKYVNEFRDRRGKLRRYFRRPGRPAISLPGEPGSPKFMKSYEAALAGLPPPAQRRAKKQLDHADRAQTPPKVGVYLLFLGDEVVYVGSSMNMPDRIAAHRGNGRPFDRAYFIATKLSERGKVERALIRALQPSQNRNLNIDRTPRRRAFTNRLTNQSEGGGFSTLRIASLSSA
jgi:hypothetical protein